MNQHLKDVLESQFIPEIANIIYGYAPILEPADAWEKAGQVRHHIHQAVSMIGSLKLGEVEIYPRFYRVRLYGFIHRIYIVILRCDFKTYPSEQCFICSQNIGELIAAQLQRGAIHRLDADHLIIGDRDFRTERYDTDIKYILHPRSCVLPMTITMDMYNLIQLFFSALKLTKVT